MPSKKINARPMVMNNQLASYAIMVLKTGSEQEFNTLIEAASQIKQEALQQKALQQLLLVVAESESDFAHALITPLVTAGANLSHIYPATGLSVMHRVNRVDTANALIENGGNLQTPGCDFNNVVVLPVHTANPEVRSLYMDSGESPQQLDSLGRNALFYAQTSDDVDNMERAGADIRHKEATGIRRKHVLYGAEAIHHARDKEVMHALIKHGASLAATDTRGWTPPHYYAAVKPKNFELVKASFEAGGNPNAEDLDGETPITIYGARDLNAMLDFCEKGADYDHQNGNGDTMLHKAAARSHVGFPGQQLNLITIGVDIDLKNKQGLRADLGGLPVDEMAKSSLTYAGLTGPNPSSLAAFRARLKRQLAKSSHKATRPITVGKSQPVENGKARLHIILPTPPQRPLATAARPTPAGLQ